MAQRTSLEFLSSEWDPCPAVVSGEEKGAAGPYSPTSFPIPAQSSLLCISSTGSKPIERSSSAAEFSR